jgi:myo-inositol-1(or 4)-monophosphatase
MRELELAKQAATAGGAVLTKYFRSGLAEARQKDPKKTCDLVSQADIESEETIVGLIRDAFPDHEILAEEGQRGAVDAEHLWVVDPLDGTTNFLHQIPHYAVSIAYYRRGQAICGVVYNPSRNDWYEAVRGQGARFQGEPIHVAKCPRLDEALVGIGFYYDRGTMMQATLNATRDLFEQQIHGIRRFGTASLDLAQVATGAIGAYFEYELSPWDFAAGRLLVEEAGGLVTDCRGDALQLKKSSILASNSVLHPPVLAITRKHFPTSMSE